MGKGNKKKNVTMTKPKENVVLVDIDSSTSTSNPTIPPATVTADSVEESTISSKDFSMKCAIRDCSSSAESKCGGCGKVGYCSKDHQKLHWKEHKGDCCAWKVSENKELGRFLIAVRDVKPGEIIMREKPLLVTPPKITPPICLGCYSEFRADGAETDDGRGVKPYECLNGCGFPMCKSRLCSNSKDHEPECTIARERGKVTIRDADVDHPLYQLIGMFRALGLKEKDPPAFEKLMSLEANVEKREEFRKKMEAEAEMHPQHFPVQDTSQDVKPEVGVKLIHEFFKRTDVTEDWMKTLVGIIETNGHEIPIPDQQDGHINRRVIGVYHSSSFLEHNCRPNCIKSWDLSTKEIIIRSSINIKKGDHLSISYVDPLWGTQERVGLLKMTKFFTCTCDRCTDASELGTHISSLRCHHLKCMNTGNSPTSLPKEGMLVPVDPYRRDGDWKCISCREDYNASYTMSLLLNVGQEMDELHGKAGDIAAREEFLKKFSKKLSPNHFYLLEIKMELAQIYGRVVDDPLHAMAPKKILRKIQLCEELLIVFNVICPGYSRLRSLILYELQAAVHTLSNIRRGVGEISLEKHLDELMQCGKWMTEVIKVLGWETPNSIERKRASGAERDLEQLRNAVLSLSQSTATTLSPQDQLSSSKTKGGEKKEDKDIDIEEIKRSHLTADDESFIEEVF